MKELLKHTPSLPECKFLPSLHDVIKSRSKSDDLESKKETHNNILNTGALRHLRRAFPHHHKRRTQNRRHLKKKKIIDRRKKEQETEKNPSSL
jgi:hypothetical protein